MDQQRRQDGPSDLEDDNGDDNASKPDIPRTATHQSGCLPPNTDNDTAKEDEDHYLFLDTASSVSSLTSRSFVTANLDQNNEEVSRRVAGRRLTERNNPSNREGVPINGPTTTTTRAGATFNEDGLGEIANYPIEEEQEGVVRNFVTLSAESQSLPATLQQNASLNPKAEVVAGGDENLDNVKSNQSEVSPTTSETAWRTSVAQEKHIKEERLGLSSSPPTPSSNTETHENQKEGDKSCPNTEISLPSNYIASSPEDDCEEGKDDAPRGGLSLGPSDHGHTIANRTTTPGAVHVKGEDHSGEEKLSKEDSKSEKQTPTLAHGQFARVTESAEAHQPVSTSQQQPEDVESTTMPSVSDLCGSIGTLPRLGRHEVAQEDEEEEAEAVSPGAVRVGNDTTDDEDSIAVPSVRRLPSLQPPLLDAELVEDSNLDVEALVEARVEEQRETERKNIAIAHASASTDFTLDCSNDGNNNQNNNHNRSVYIIALAVLAGALAIAVAVIVVKTTGQDRNNTNNDDELGATPGGVNSGSFATPLPITDAPANASPGASPSALPTPFSVVVDDDDSGFFDPPSPEECADISNGIPIKDKDGIVPFRFIAEVDAYMFLDETHYKELLGGLQRQIAPLLAGCALNDDQKRERHLNDAESNRIVNVRFHRVEIRDGKCEIDSIEDCVPLFLTFTVFVFGDRRVKAFELVGPFRQGLEEDISVLDRVVEMDFVNIYLDSPTSSPTLLPYTNPTSSPTSLPTMIPGNPTSSPATSMPSASPTTSNPTAAPTTSSPTAKPTRTESNHPSSQPSKAPTTFEPSSRPTKIPTVILVPTVPPNPDFSSNPTSTPAPPPTASPSRTPSLSPVMNPTKVPTVSPSSNPSPSPTSNPTRNPSPFPTASPTRNPSRSPTDRPTRAPTPRPSPFPTEWPTSPVGTSCIGENACLGSPGLGLDDDEDSCVGVDACYSIEGELYISSDACQGHDACSYFVSGGHSIGSGGCQGNSACSILWYTDVGSDSCVGDHACFDGYNEYIGSESCQGDHSCAETYGVIGSDSCQGDFACYYLDGDIGDNSCNCDDCCSCFTDEDIPDDSCNSLGECCGCAELVVEVHSDEWGCEIYVELVDEESGDTVFEEQDFENLDVTTMTEDCLAMTGCYTLTVYDSFGDGLLDGGQIVVILNGDVVLEESDYGDKVEYQMGLNC